MCNRKGVKIAEAVRDGNRIASLLGASNADGTTPIVVWVDPTTHRLLVNATVTGTITVADDIGTTTIAGQATVAVTNTAVQLASNACKNGVIVQALAANAGNVVVGPSGVTTANGFQLQPGQATSIAVSNTSAIWLNGTALDGVCFITSV